MFLNKMIPNLFINRCILRKLNCNVKCFSNSVRLRKNALLEKYSDKEKECILKALNNFSETSLNYKINKNQLGILKTYLQENREFKSLDEVLHLNGIGPALLKKLCNEVISGENNASNVTNNIQLIESSKSNYLTPAITETSKQNIESVIGIHIGNFSVTWARLDYLTKTVTHWQQETFTDVGDLKNVVNIFKFVRDLEKEIPRCDAYVMETVNWSIMTAQTNLLHHVRAAQMTAMLTAMLNSYSRQGKQNKFEQDDYVYFLKTYLPTRYFRTLIGSERVSPQNMVDGMLGGNFPEYCTSVKVNEDCKEYYFSKDRSLREALCYSFLLSITFMDVILHNKVDQLRAVSKK